MQYLIVVNQLREWPLELPNTQVVTARAYLTDPAYFEMEGVRVFNLCRSYRYQSIGYYVSLLALARGHKPMPSLVTIQDLKSSSMIRLAGEELEELIQYSFRSLQSDKFTLNIYFGDHMDRRYERLALRLYQWFQAPILRAEFALGEGVWRLMSIRALPAKEIPAEERDFAFRVVEKYFSQTSHRPTPKRFEGRYDLAILHDPEEPWPPSNGRALQKFIKAARKLGISADLIDKEDQGLLPQYDALFIRATTQVTHYTYRFARRAVAEGLVTIDDPDSILKCSNKVYMAELLDMRDVPHPRTLIVHQDNVGHILAEVGLPCILKKPDSFFSQGVYKAETEAQLDQRARKLLEESDLIIAQEFIPTPFDWRVGILDRRPLYVCKYYMVNKKSWQIQTTDVHGASRTGKHESLPIEIAPRRVIQTALRAANAIGDGFYGVDLKEHDGKVYVMEVNDNPSIETGVEDSYLKDELYITIMQVFLQRIQQRKGARL